MIKQDGALKRENKPVIIMVSFGNVDMNLFHHLKRSLSHFLQSVDDQLNCLPEIQLMKRENPMVIELGQEENVFYSELDKIHGEIVLGVTEMGIYSITDGKNIFGFGRGGEGLLSYLRFKKNPPRKMYDRLGKEIIKILGLTIDLGHCWDDKCILIRHRHTHELDNNNGLCKDCASKMVDNLNYYLDI